MEITLPRYYYDSSFRKFEQLLTNNRQPRHYPAGSQLVTSGEFMDDTYFVHEGILKFYIISSTGAEKTEWFIGPGALFPLYSPLERRYKGERDEFLVKTQTDCRLTKIPQRKIKSLIDTNSDFAKVMVRQYADFTSILLYDIINLVSASSLTKVCNYLYQYEKLLRPHGIVLSQDEIATNIGVPRLTLSRALKRLREEKIIVTKRKVINVIDWDKLGRYCSPELIKD